MSVFDWGNIRRPKAVLFDWDNTLVDTWPVIHHALNSTFTAFDKEVWTVEETMDRVRLSLRDAFPSIFGDEWEAAREHFYQAFQAVHLERLKVLPDAENLLANLAEEGIFLGIVSNKTGVYLRDEVTHLGWNKYFNALVGAGDAKKDKPAIDPLHLALNNSEADAGPDVWFVGDSGVDMEIAHVGGCVPVLIRVDAGPEGEFDGHPPQFKFSNCREFLDALKHI